MTLRPVFRWLALAFSILFVAFAALQWNDPDPLLWIFIYLLPAAAFFLGFTGRVWRLPSLALAIIYFAGAVLWFPEEYMGLSLENGYTLEIELARESLGLGLCSILLLIVFGAGVRRKQQ